MYDAEQKLAQILPTLAQESQEQPVKDAFLEHQQETLQHVRNLEQCFQILGRSPIPVENHGVTGLKQDHDAFLQQGPSAMVLTMFDLSAAVKDGIKSRRVAILAALMRLGDARHFVAEAYKHGKAIGATGEGTELLQSIEIPTQPASDQVKSESGGIINSYSVVTSPMIANLTPFITQFIEAIAQHRHWFRPQMEEVPA